MSAVPDGTPAQSLLGALTPTKNRAGLERNQERCIPQGLKPVFCLCHCGTAKQAAEKGLNSSNIPEKHPAGAKARRLFCGTYGTTKVVP